MTESDSFDVRTAPRGPRWIGWVVRPGDRGPWRSVVVVAATKEDAEIRARKWAEAQMLASSVHEPSQPG